MENTDLIGKKLGNYRLTRLLGQGGFANVYLGEHIHLNTLAAMKVLQARLVGSDIEQFRNEARRLAHLRHPNIVHVLDFGVDNEIPFLVMEYATHGTLRSRHPKGTVVSLATVLPYVKQVAAALQFAHDQRVIHRDIKPENMLIGEHGEILLSDFGIAIINQSSRYHNVEDIVGTVAYMAPEQIQGRPVFASDQYSLGIVLYEWLTGQRPFNGSVIEVTVQHLSVAPRPLRQLVPSLSAEVEEVVHRALAKDPQARFGSLQAFAVAFEQAAQMSGLSRGQTHITAPNMSPLSPMPPTPPQVPRMNAFPQQPAVQPIGFSQTGPPSSMPWLQRARSFTQRVPPRILAIAAAAVLVIFLGSILLSMLAAHQNGSNPPGTLSSGGAQQRGSGTATVSSGTAQATAGGTTTPDATATTASTSTASGSTQGGGVLLYKSDWSKDLGGWIGSGQWKALNGQLLSDGNGQASILSPYLPESRSDYAVEARVQVLRVHPAGCSNFGIMVRTTPDNQSGYKVLANCLALAAPFSGKVEIDTDRNLAQADYAPGSDVHVYRLEVQANYIRLLIDGTVILTTICNKFLAGGRIGLSMDSTEIIVDSVSIYGISSGTIPMTPTPSFPQVSKVLYQADWSKGLNQWASSGSWQVLNGQLISNGSGQSTILAPYTPTIPDYAVEMQVQVIRVYPAGCSNFGLIVRSTQDLQSGYKVLANCLSVSTPFSGQIEIDSDTNLTKANYTPNSDWHTYRVEVKGNHISFLIDGSVAIETTSNQYLSAGYIGLTMDSTEMNVASYIVTSL